MLISLHHPLSLDYSNPRILFSKKRVSRLIDIPGYIVVGPGRSMIRDPKTEALYDKCVKSRPNPQIIMFSPLYDKY